MIMLTKVREAQGFSMRKLDKVANVCASDISKAESRGLKLYPVQMERIAAALGWTDDPMLLLEEVADDE